MGRIFTGEIGNLKLLSFGQPHRTIGRTGLRGREALALFVVLVLSVGAFVLAAGEARAQQHPAPEVYAAVIGPERTPVTDVGDAGPEIEAPPPDSSQSQTDGRDAGPSPQPEPDPVTPGDPEPALALLEELAPTPGPDLVPDPEMLESFGNVVEPGPAYDLSYGPEVALADPGPSPGPRDPVWFVDPPPAPAPTGLGPALPYPRLAIEPVPGPVASGENKPPSPHVGEKLPVLSPTGSPQGVRTAPLPGNGPANAAPVWPSPSVADRKAPAPVPVVPKPPIPGSAVTDPPREASLLLSDLEAAASSAVETLQGAASVAAGAAVGVSEALATGDGDSTGASPGGAEGTSQQEAPAPPLPPSPAPLGGSSFSLSGAGQIGPGGVVPLLMGILAAGLILLRPTGRLSWASCELPKPSSALLVPLERPG